MSLRSPYISKRTEPDMRRELDNTFDGIFPEVAKKQTAVLRKMRLDENDELIKCPCIDPVTKEPDLDHFCPVCWGEGNIWDEILVDTYRVSFRANVAGASEERTIAPGFSRIDLVAFYLRSSDLVTDKDKIIKLVTKRDGTPKRPYKREVLYRIVSAIDFRLDNAKLEYWKLDCYEEDRKFLNGGW